MQYPKTQTLYKKETFPPNILAFTVTTAAPPHINMNITPLFIFIILFLPNNELVPYVECIPRVNANKRHSSKGPYIFN